MKKCYRTPRLIVLLFSVAILGFAPAYAGTGYEYSRSELMGNSGLTIFREADYGNQNGLSIYLDGIPITTLSRGEGYRAIVRPGRHLLTVTNAPSPYGKDQVHSSNYRFSAGAKLRVYRDLGRRDRNA